MEKELDDLVQRYIDGTITADEMRSLNRRLGSDADSRRSFTDSLDMDSGLGALAAGWRDGAGDGGEPFGRDSIGMHRVSSPGHAAGRRRRVRPVWPVRYGLVAAAIGMLLGIAGTRWVSAVVSPLPPVSVERLTMLQEAGLEVPAGPIHSGFPAEVGIWGGDEAGIVSGPAAFRDEGTRVLRFLSAGADPGDPRGRAISCDLFQIVDLEAARVSLTDGGEAVLELSADFLDARREAGDSVTFICQIFLFRGEFDTQHEVWPRSLGDALGSGAMLWESVGGDPDWRTLTARCLLHPQADFAVVQIGALPNGPRRELSEQYADRVRLSLRVPPTSIGDREKP